MGFSWMSCRFATDIRCNTSTGDRESGFGLERIMFFEFYTTFIFVFELIVSACIALHIPVEIS